MEEMKDRSLDAMNVSFRVVLTCNNVLFGRGDENSLAGSCV